MNVRNALCEAREVIVSLACLLTALGGAKGENIAQG